MTQDEINGLRLFEFVCGLQGRAIAFTTWETRHTWTLIAAHARKLIAEELTETAVREEQEHSA